MRSRILLVSILFFVHIPSALAGFANAHHHQAAREIEQALHMAPDLKNGLRVYRMCAVCHLPEAWQSNAGYYPQIAGQHASVIIKQLADIRAGNRDVPTMFPFALVRTLSVQDMADVSAYIEQMPMAPSNKIGPGRYLALGKRLYAEHCVDCHGEKGEGDPIEHMPLIQGQHFDYLNRQFHWIRNGRRRNADRDMVQQARTFTEREIAAIMDYVSRLRPPAEKTAAPGYRNKDFPHFVRGMRPSGQ